MRLRADDSNVFTGPEFILEHLKQKLIYSWYYQHKLLIAHLPHVEKHIFKMLHILGGAPYKL